MRLNTHLAAVHFVTPVPIESKKNLPIVLGIDKYMSIKCKFFNARSLKNKLSELHYTLYSSYLLIICVAESWLNDSVTNAMLDPLGLFDIYCRDRPSHAGGVIARP